jgi:hypothetical protein
LRETQPLPDEEPKSVRIKKCRKKMKTKKQII